MPSRKADNSQIRENLPDLAPLSDSLLTISRSLAVIALRLSHVRNAGNDQQIHFLNTLGIGRHDIAAIVGTTPNTVSVTLSTGRGKKRTRQSRRRGKNKR